MKRYYVYILKCSDNSYYTGITNNVTRRINEHKTTDGSQHVKYRQPFTLVYTESFTTPLKAINREKQIKRWSRRKKEALILGDFFSLKTYGSMVRDEA